MKRMLIVIACIVGLFLLVQPIQMQAKANSVNAEINKATKQMTKAYRLYIDSVKKEKKLPNTMKMKKETKLAEQYYTNAAKAIKKNGGSKKQQASYTAKLNKKKKELDRAKSYIAAINVNVNSTRASLNNTIKEGKPASTFAAYEKHRKRTADFSKQIAKVYGSSIRKMLRDTHLKQANSALTSVENEMQVFAVYKEIADKNLIVIDIKSAEKLINGVKTEARKVQVKKTKLAKAIQKEITKYNSQLDKAKNSPFEVKEITVNESKIDIIFTEALQTKGTNNATKLSHYSLNKQVLPKATKITVESKNKVVITLPEGSFKPDVDYSLIINKNLASYDGSILSGKVEYLIIEADFEVIEIN